MILKKYNAVLGSAIQINSVFTHSSIMNYQQWVIVLDQAIKKYPTFNQRTKIQEQADSWRTCAIGAKIMCDLGIKNKSEIPKKISRAFDSDNILRKASIQGQKFPSLIRFGHYAQARKLLDKIYESKSVLTKRKMEDLRNLI